MMKHKITALFMGLALLLSFSACEDYFGDINVNPNSPVDVPPSVLLPSLEVNVADVTGGDFSRFTSILVNHVRGVARQWSSIDNYSFIVPSNFDNAWRYNIYAGILQDARVLKEKASSVEAGAGHYVGIANVLMAYTWMMATDVWNDMPYREAFQGTDNLQPAFDSQEFIYSEIDNMLSEAISLFNGDGGALVPGSDDLIYGGDISKWLKAAHLLAARAALHRALLDENKYYNDVLTHLANAFEGPEDDMRLQYTSGPTSAAPWYRFNRDRTGDIQMAEGSKMSALYLIMTDLNDPRLPIYSADFVDFDNHPYFKPDRNYPLATYTEQKFMEAEALMKTGGDAAAIHDAFVAGIQSSFDELGLDATDYLAAIDPGEGNVTMEDIMTQKYIALYTQPEVYNDWRRTEIPTLTPNSGSTIPYRFPYPASELTLNLNTPNVDGLDAITDPANKVWWDKN